jgi:hypothetical protein
MLLLTCITLLNFNKMSARAESTEESLGRTKSAESLERTRSQDLPVEIQKHSRQQRYLANQSFSSTNTVNNRNSPSTASTISNKSLTLQGNRSSISNATDICKDASTAVVGYNIILSIALSPVGFIALFIVDYYACCKSSSSKEKAQNASDNEMATANGCPLQAAPYQPQALESLQEHAGPNYPQYPAPAAENPEQNAENESDNEKAPAYGYQSQAAPYQPQALESLPVHTGPSYPQYPAPAAGYPAPAAAATAAAYPLQYVAPAGGGGGGYAALTYYDAQAQPTAYGGMVYADPAAKGESSHCEVPTQAVMTVSTSDEPGTLRKSKERELKNVWPTEISEYYQSAANLLYQIGYRGVFVFIQIRSGNFVNPALFLIDLIMAAYFGAQKLYCPGCLYNDIHVLLYKKKFENVSIPGLSRCKFNASSDGYLP